LSNRHATAGRPKIDERRLTMFKSNKTGLASLAATVVVVLCTLGAMVSQAGAASSSESVVSAITDWTAASANTATGTLLGTPVSLSGTHVWGTPQTTLDGSAPYFATSVFSPALAKSDAIQISGGPDRPFTY